jgi:predicted GIY-YIG superfamily endonuclease
MNFWYNYIIFNKTNNKTYIGSTINITRRFRQHNGEIKGGAKYTRGGIWEPYIILADLDHTKNTALSYEWHLKRSSKKFKNLNSKLKRKKGLEKFINTKISNKCKHIYTHILFINNKFRFLTPILPSQVLIFYLNSDNIKSEQISDYINFVKNCNKLKMANIRELHVQ